ARAVPRAGRARRALRRPPAPQPVPAPMIRRLRSEEGFGIVELVVATVVLTVALLALMAAYDEAFVSLHKSARTSSAATLAETQLELYGALPVASTGLSPTKLTAAASGAYHGTGEGALSPTRTAATNPSGGPT